MSSAAAGASERQQSVTFCNVLCRAAPSQVSGSREPGFPFCPPSSSPQPGVGQPGVEAALSPIGDKSGTSSTAARSECLPPARCRAPGWYQLVPFCLPSQPPAPASGHLAYFEHFKKAYYRRSAILAAASASRAGYRSGLNPGASASALSSDCNASEHAACVPASGNAS